MNRLSSILVLLLALAACDDSGENKLIIDDGPEVTLQAIAGADQDVNEGVEVVLEGSSESSDSSLSLSYSWEQFGGKAVVLSSADSQVASFSAAVDADAKLSFRLLVQSTSGLEATDELVVSVNNAPTAVIEGPSRVAEGANVDLSGWQSADSDDGSIVAYDWTQIAGASVALYYEDQASVSFAAPSVSGDENVSFELVVTDDDGAVDSTTISIEVTDDSEDPSIAAVYLTAGLYGIEDDLIITLEAVDAETDLALKDGSNFNGQELTDFAPIPGQDGNYTAIYTVAGNNPSRDYGQTASANLVLVDPAGNESAAITEVELDGVSIDTLPPALNSFSVSEGDYAIGMDVEITVVAVNSETNLSLRAGSTFNDQKLTDFTAVEGKDGYYTAIYTVTSGNPDLAPGAEATMSLVVLDPAGNESTEYIGLTLSDATSVDANAPVVLSVGVASGAYGIDDNVRISINADESETALTLSPNANSFNGRSLSQFVHIDSGVYSAIYTVQEGDQDIADNSDVDINIALVDAHGNVGAAVVSAQLSNSSIDATRPQLSVLNISDGIYGIGSDLAIFLRAAGDEVGLELQNSTFNGKSLIDFSDLQNGLYALTYSIEAGDSDQAEGNNVDANIALVDAVGNSSLSITTINLNGESIDATAPVIESISVADGTYIIGDEVEIYISALENNLRLQTGSSFNGQELSDFQAISGEDGNYSAIYTIVEGDASVDVNSEAISDIVVLDTADNPSNTVSAVNIGARTSIGAQTINIVGVEVAEGVHRIGSSVVVTITTSGTSSNLALKSGSSFNSQSFSGLTAVADADGVYQAIYTVTSGNPDVAAGGVVSTSIVLEDSAGNESNEYTSVSLSADTSIDANAPEITNLEAAAGAYGIGAAIEIMISALNAETGLALAAGSTFNDQLVTGFSAVDGQDGDYVVTYTVVEGDDDVASGSSATANIALVDTALNQGSSAQSIFLEQTTIDANRPNIASIAVDRGDFGVGAEVVITFTAADNDTDLDLTSSSFNGETLSDFSNNGDGTYNATYTVAEGNADIAVGNAVSTDIVFTDAIGNVGAAIESLILTETSIDANSPTVASVSVEPGVYKVGEDVYYTITAGNNEAGLTLSYADLFNGNGLLFTTDNGDGTYTTNYYVTEGDPDVPSGGTVAVDISFEDAAGNHGPSFTEADLPEGTSIDANSPGVSSVSVPDGNHTVGDAVPITITASGKETGLTLSSKTFNGQELTGITDNLDGTYTANYTVEEGDPDIDNGDKVTIEIAFIDPSGNESDAEESVLLSGARIDANTPTIASVSVAAGAYRVGDEVAITITAGDSEENLNLQSGSSFHGSELHSFAATNQDGVYQTIYTVEIADTSLADGDTVIVNIVLADRVGNQSAAVTELILDGTSVDTSAPSISNVLVSEDNIINSSDDLSSIAVSGSTSGIKDGLEVTLTIGGITEKAGVIADNVDVGSFSTTVDLSDLADSAAIAVTAEATDVAGNLAQFTGSLLKDVLAPSQSIKDIKLSADTGTQGDLITNIAAQSITAELSAMLEDGDILYGSVDSGTIWHDISTSVTNTTINWSTTLSSGSIMFKIADSVGNEGDVYQQAYTLDTEAPAQIISAISFSDDSGTPDDFITNVAAQDISATLSAGLGDTETLYASVDSGASWDDINNSISNTTDIVWSGATLATGTHDLILRIADTADNNYSITQKYTLDQADPSANTSDSDSEVDEASTATLDASASSDAGSGIISYAWKQVRSDGGTLAADATTLAIANADQDIASVSTPGIADDSGDNQFFYFAVTITDTADNSYTSLPQVLQVNNSYTTPALSAVNAAPDFDQISLSWSADSSLTYSLYRSTDSACDLGNYISCANPALYTDSTGIAINDSSASVTDTSLEFFTPYYYWLGAQIGTEVVFLNSDWTEQITTSGPVLNDTGITGGGDYPSGFDALGGGVCNGGYFTDQGTVVSDLTLYEDTSSLTFVAFADEDCERGRDADTSLNDDSDGNAAFVFTKLDIAGNVTTSTTIGDWACVLDHTTGLIWEVKTDDDSLRDKDKGFTWHDPDNSTFTGTESNQDTQDFINYLNIDSSINSGNGLCGRSDWRLPTVHEIQGLADYDAVVANDSGGYSTPSADTDYFPYTIASQYQWYWTSHLNVDPDVNPNGDDTVAGSSTSNYYAWAYNSAESRTRSGTGSTVGSTVRSNYVRLVSSSAAVESHFSDYSDNRYTDHGDGTISDARTGLMWMQCSYGQTYDGGDTNGDGIICEGSPTFGSWQQAFAWAADSNANVDYGYNDWRLPNIKELGSIVDFGSAKPAINQSIFPNTSTGSYWTSTPSKALDGDGNDDTQSANIWFQTGDHGLNNRTTDLYLRLVR